MTTVIYDVKPGCKKIAETRTMKVTREQAAQNRDRVLDVAARLFRERGFDGIGVADLMKIAGLTHGGFYGQFTSKEDLMALACARAGQDSLKKFQAAADRTPGSPLTGVAHMYLSKAHRDQPGKGCLVAALGADAAREGPTLRTAVTESVRSVVGLLAGLVRGRTEAIKRARALNTYASMVGALVLARAVDDEALSDEILQSVLAAILKTAAR
jgi:TetR/AcrR family transcriptional regulator, transcriptional repressor for nem operon